MITENEATTSPYVNNHNEDSNHDESSLDARLLAASDLTFTSVDDSFLANLSASAATVQTDEAEWQQIIAWLKDLYDTQEEVVLPNVPRTSYNLRTLRALMQLNELHDNVARMIIKTGQLHNDELLLEEMATDMDLDKLPRDIRIRLDLLAHLACSLGLSELTPGSVTAAMYDLVNDEFTRRLQHDKLKERLDAIRDQRRELSVRLANMHYQHEMADVSRVDMKQRILEWQQNTDVLLQKANEYDTRTVQHKARYEATGVLADQFDIKSITELEKRVEETEQDYKRITRQLDAFHALPPDLNLAQLKLMEAREQLRILREQRDELLSSMVDSLQ
ncbi:hypothetical protein BDF22DRAFT_653717 [Syncephalis plumigaleata]|nr:hypothetical protein BDF22DRAFT_653717 [Syncephalis plumigaleata]